jgi:hypothetical protein
MTTSTIEGFNQARSHELDRLKGGEALRTKPAKYCYATLGTSHTDTIVATDNHKGNSLIADQSFATVKPYDATYVFTSFLNFLNSGRNTSNATLFVKKPLANSNNASMSLGLYQFHEGMNLEDMKHLELAVPLAS